MGPHPRLTAPPSNPRPPPPRRRGTTDNKGPVLAFVYAVRELLEECKGGSGARCLPANVAFIFEGEGGGRVGGGG